MEGTPWAYMRQDGDRVYVNTSNLNVHRLGEDGDSNEDIDSEYLLYDFSLKVGDRFETLGFDEGHGIVVEAEVTATYETENQGHTYRVQEYAVVYDGWIDIRDRDNLTSDAVIIEGVGPDWGYLFEPRTVGIFTHIPSSIYPLEVKSTDGSPEWVTKSRGCAGLVTMGNKMVNTEFEWEYRTPGDFGYVDFRMRFDDIYIIDDQIYLNFHTLSHTVVSNDGDIVEVKYPDETMFLLREEDKKVYMRIRDYSCFPRLETWYEETGEDKEYLLYDFSLKVGESADFLTTSGELPMTLKSKLYSNDYNKRWTYTYETPAGEEISINDSFGNITNGTLATIEAVPMDGFRHESPVDSYPTPYFPTYPVKVVNTYRGAVEWENTGLGAVESVHDDLTSDGAIYDLYGRRVVNPLPGTIYIRDGRKYVAR